jgi:hypothetical protein
MLWDVPVLLIDEKFISRIYIFERWVLEKFLFVPISLQICVEINHPLVHRFIWFGLGRGNPHVVL